jgi:hypothetical protein
MERKRSLHLGLKEQKMEEETKTTFQISKKLSKGTKKEIKRQPLQIQRHYHDEQHPQSCYYKYKIYKLERTLKQKLTAPHLEFQTCFFLQL